MPACATLTARIILEFRSFIDAAVQADKGQQVTCNDLLGTAVAPPPAQPGAARISVKLGGSSEVKREKKAKKEKKEKKEKEDDKKVGLRYLRWVQLLQVQCSLSHWRL